MVDSNFAFLKNIQNQLFDLNADHLLTTEVFLFQGIFSDDNNVIVSFYRILINCLMYRPNKTELYIRYLIDTHNKLDQPRKNAFNQIILEWSFHLPGPNIVHLFVLFRLYDIGLIGIDQILQSIRNFRFHNQNMKINLVYCLLWFAPEIQQKYDHLFHLLLSDLQEFKQNSPNHLLIKKLDINSLFSKNFSLLRKYRKSGHNPNALFSIIMNDDLTDLRQVNTEFGFDINQVIDPSFYEICPFIQNQPSLIEISAFFGSLECFKFLLLIECDLKSSVNPNENVFHFAVAGGNNEIIRVCSQRKLPLNGGPQVAAMFYRNSILEWLIENDLQGITDCTKEFGSVIQSAAISNNLEAIELCMNLKVDINEGALNKTALHEACENGNLESVILLLTSKRININACISIYVFNRVFLKIFIGFQLFNY